MKTFSIRTALKRGWTLWKEHTQVLVIATIITVVLGGSYGSHRHEHWGMLAWLFMVALFAIGMIIQIGWLKIVLKVEDGGSPDVKEIAEHSHLFWRYLGTHIIYGLMVVIGCILFIIPGIYVMLRYQYALIILVDRNTSIGHAFKESARITKGQKLHLFGFLLVLAALNILGAACLVVGLLVTIPVSTLAAMHVYRTLEKTA